MGCASSRATEGRNGDDTVAGHLGDGTVGQSPQVSADTALPAPGRGYLAQRARRGSVRLPDQLNPFIDALVPTARCRAQGTQDDASIDFPGIQVSAEVKSFSATKVEALNLRKSLQTKDNLIGALRHCFLFQGKTCKSFSCSTHVLISLAIAAMELLDAICTSLGAAAAGKASRS